MLKNDGNIYVNRNTIRGLKWGTLKKIAGNCMTQTRNDLVVNCEAHSKHMAKSCVKLLRLAFIHILL